MNSIEWALHLGGYWMPIHDGDCRGRFLYNRHYSRHHYKDGRRPKLFVGPGQKLCLMTSDCRALFVWRKFIDKSGQVGVNCAVFRNEGTFNGAIRSCELIFAAEKLAWARCPNERLYTYVNPKKVQSENPCYCFKQAGWKVCGMTKVNKLIILEKYPKGEICDY